MNKVYKVILLTFLTGLFFIDSKAQENGTLNNIVSKIQEFDLSSPPEKVYIHFDKPYYATADTIWLKTYVTQGLNQPTQLSKIVYVELYNDTDSLMTQLKLAVADGGAQGHIPLTIGNYKQGNYYVRAYTQWMLNFDSDYFFYKNIPVGDGVNKKVTTHVEYIKDNSGKINAKISFRTANNSFVSAKTVNWQVLTNLDVQNKGRLTTDATGSIIIPVSSDPKKDLSGKLGQIITSVDLIDGGRPAVTTIRIPNVFDEYDVQFFPEGGELLTGIPQQVAYKVINSSGIGVNVKGKITDKNGNSITNVNSSHFGMGSFYLNSEESNIYTAELIFPDGSTKKYPLPNSKKSGVTLQASTVSKDVIDVKLMSTLDLVGTESSGNYYVLGQMNGSVYFSATIPLQKQVTTFKIPKKDLPIGLMQLTVFSGSSEAISERLVFVSKESDFQVALKSDKAEYGIKQKVKLTISATDSLKATQGNLSIAVIDESKAPIAEENETTILSTLLLTGDLTGYIEKPNYYFSNTNEEKLAKLDLLLLTQGYRRFTYSDILKDVYPNIKLLPEQGINITGTLRNKTGLPINKGTLLLTIPSIKYNKDLTTGTTGKFEFKNLVFPDSSEVVITARYNPNPTNLMLMVDGFPEPSDSRNKNNAEYLVNIDSTLSKYLENNGKQYKFLQTIEEVEVVSSRPSRSAHLDHPALGTLPMMADDVIESSFLLPCNILPQCIRSKVPGITFHENNFYLTREFNAGSRVPMLIHLNNFAIDYAGLANINPADILNIQMFYRDPIGTLSKANNTSGVMVINTKPESKTGGTKMSLSDLRAMIPESHTNKMLPKGYSIERKFYEPKYGVNPTELNFTDLRTTVYWNPKIQLNENGEAIVEFFNSDGKGKYKAIVEGINEKGNVARKVFRYTVK